MEPTQITGFCRCFLSGFPRVGKINAREYFFWTGWFMHLFRVGILSYVYFRQVAVYIIIGFLIHSAYIYSLFYTFFFTGLIFRKTTSDQPVHDALKLVSVFIVMFFYSFNCVNKKSSEQWTSLANVSSYLKKNKRCCISVSVYTQKINSFNYMRASIFCYCPIKENITASPGQRYSKKKFPGTGFLFALLSLYCIFPVLDNASAKFRRSIFSFSFWYYFY